MRTIIPRSILSAFLLALVLTAMARPARAADVRCFTETGQCISGRFREFWEQNGGLPVFGFPISSAHNELNRETGQAYLTQWFERNRFELHPEQSRPYDVLLGRLGDDRLRRLGVVWQSQPGEAGPRAGCMWFEQTGHNVCDQADGLGFRSYWQRHGLLDPRLDAYGRSLALFGLPLSEAKASLSPTDGQTYLTQWFERARLEWHPDKLDEYKVLLGLLGDEVQVVRGPAQLVSSTMVGQPVAAGRYLFWNDIRGGTPSLYSYDLDTRAESLVAEQVNPLAVPASDGNGLAWVARSPDSGRAQIWYTDLGARQPRLLVEAGDPNGQQPDSMALADGVLYYSGFDAQHHGLYARDVASGAEQQISGAGFSPVAANGTLVWSESSGTGSGAAYRQTNSLHLLRLHDRDQRVLATAEGQGAFIYRVSGDSVVWLFNAAGADNRVYLHRISTGVSAPISPDAAQSVGIAGPHVVWATDPFFDRDPSPTWAVQAYDLDTGALTTLLDQLPAQSGRQIALARDQVALAIDTGELTEGVGMRRWLYLIAL
jgi:hypothetical protein